LSHYHDGTPTPEDRHGHDRSEMVDDSLRSGRAPRRPFGPEGVDRALHTMIAANEAALRMMLAQSLERSARGEIDAQMPLRQNRRTPPIEAALGLASDRFEPVARLGWRAAPPRRSEVPPHT
jgi:hypothetical protein